ncbi:PIN domain-containing protein [Anabaena sp. CCY 0017]|uniref:PIN domain-containing protein n=1 Tax=Anabaena sp. CCY 0017 TaxID=3103866 RepID=UPI0039C5ACEB
MIDTVALISYFAHIFNVPSKISQKGLSYIDIAFKDYNSKYLIIIPGVVFIEIFDKWFRGNTTENKEFRAKFISEVFNPIKLAPNIEIRELDIEVLESFLDLKDENINLENRDKIVLATAIILNSPLITCDTKLKCTLTNYLTI